MRQFAERQAINAPIQGTAADVIRRAMVRMPDAISKAGLDARMLLQVHDELVFEVKTELVPEISKMIQHLMSQAMDLDVPLIAEAGSGDNWEQAH